MRLAVISDFALGSPRAHAINVVKTAGGMARLGHEVTLLCGEPEESGDGAPAALRIRRALCDYGEDRLHAVCMPGRAGPERARAFAAWARERLAGFDGAYARHFDGALTALACGLPTVLEAHAWVGDDNPRLLACLEATRRTPALEMSTISHRLRAYYIERGADPARIRIVPDGVDYALFARPARLGPSPLGEPGPHAVYAGHLYESKGMSAIIDAARCAPGIRWHLVGGVPEDQARVAAQAEGLSNVVIHGRVPHAAVPGYLWHAGALLLPVSAKDPSCNWTSPVKLGEYLAAGAPVVCSRVPALLDALSDEVSWCEPDDGADLARAVDAVLHEGGAARAARLARADALAQRLDYAQRARRLLGAIVPARSAAA